MKKILSVLAVMAVACSAFSQGSILVSAPGNSVQFRAPNADSAPANVAAGAGFLQVLWAPAGSAMTAWSAGGNQNLTQWLAANSAWKIAKASDGTTDFVKSISNAGRLLPVGVTVGTTSPVDLILVGWTGSANSFDLAYAGAAAPSANGVTVGFSDRFLNITPATGTTPPPTAAFTGITMTPTAIVPEPSTFALAGLGAAALMIFRRRK